MKDSQVILLGTDLNPIKTKINGLTVLSHQHLKTAPEKGTETIGGLTQKKTYKSSI